MKKLMTLCFFALPFLVYGQQTLTIDLKTGKLTGPKVDVNKDITLAFSNIEAAEGHPQIHIDLLMPAKAPAFQSTDCHVNYVFNINTLYGAMTGPLTVTLSNEIGASLKFIVKFTINTKGEIGELHEDHAPVYFTIREPELLTTPPPEYTGYKSVFYDLRINQYLIFNKTRLRNGLWYRPFSRKQPGHGVVFVMDNFNVLKYDATISSTYNSRFTDVPDLFNSIVSMVGTGPAASSTSAELALEIAKIYQLNADLKRLINLDRQDFRAAKTEFRDNAALNFGKPNGVINIAENYNAQKSAMITDHVNGHAASGNRPALAANPKYASADFNQEVQKDLHLVLNPDSLVNETLNLYNLVQSTEFRLQSNVIQLQSADELQFTVNIAGKANVKNPTVSVPSQPLSVPILGIVKVEFSTGFYYSSIKNETYTLRKSQQDSTKKEIVGEDNVSGRTLGIAALMHIYPRLLTGFNPAFTFGLGKSMDLNYSILYGASVLIGRNNRMVISAGGNISNIKALSKANYYDNGTKILQPASATNVSTYNKFKSGAFISFTYAFGGTSSKTQAAAASPDSGSASASPASPAAGTAAAGGKGKGK